MNISRNVAVNNLLGQHEFMVAFKSMVDFKWLTECHGKAFRKVEVQHGIHLNSDIGSNSCRGIWNDIKV